jgi:hypothetical protein
MWHIADLGFACGHNLLILFVDLKILEVRRFIDSFSPYKYSFV